MDTLLNIFATEAWTHLTFTLLHTLWQAPLAAFALYLFLRLMPAEQPNRRYGAALSALACVVLASMVTWSLYRLDVPAPAPAQSVISTPAPASPHASVPIATASPTVISQTSSWAAFVAAAWLAGACAGLLRAACLLLRAGALRRGASTWDDPTVRESLTRLKSALGVARHVRVALSDRIDIPGVIGVLRPIVIFPAAVAAGMPPAHLDAILAHELAHIRRYDYWVNLLQLLIEALLFFNPAVWWISRRIRVEREACCDALAASATGLPVAYATALTDFAARLNANVAQPMLAATGNDDKHVLLDRVKRLLVPGYRPRLGLPWYTLTALLIAGMAILAALSLGVFSAVLFAAHVLTPVERMQKIEAIEQAHAPLPRDKNGEIAVKIPVSGTVRTEDGAPLPEDLKLTLLSTADGSVEFVDSCVTEGRFEQKMTPGILYATASGEGYAFSVAGPLRTTPDKPAEDLDVVLQHGTPVQIRVTSPDGAPLATAEVSGSYTLGSAGTGLFDLKTDQNGLAAFTYCEGYPVSLLVIAQGFARERYKDVKLEPDRPFECQLQPTPAASGVVRAAESGQPLEGVVLRLAGEGGPLGIRGVELEGEEVATTDAQGVYAITTLRADTEYGLVAFGPDGRRLVAGTVSAGKTLDLNLPPPIRIRGHIIGDLSVLSRDGQEPYVEYSQRIRFRFTTSIESDRAHVEIRDGEGYFETEPLWPGEVTIGAGRHQQRLDVSHSIDDFVLDLSAGAQPEESLRTVVVRFETEPGLPAPKGTVSIYAYQGDMDIVFSKEAVPIVNGEARLDVPAPNTLGCNLKDLVGYWAEGKWGIDLPAGTEPFVLNIPVRPAGAIHGRILNPDGTPATAFASFIRIKEPDDIKGKGDFDAKPVKDGNFLIAPVPFGYTCAVLAWSGARMVLSDELKINETTPIHELTLQFVPGLPIRGRLVDETGSPVTDLSVGLSYASPYSGAYGGMMVRPDSDGRFVIEGVNPDIRGRYSLESQSKQKYLPFLVDATPGGPEQTIVVKRGLALHGTVVDETGAPVKGARIMAIAHETSNIVRSYAPEVPTDDNGAFRFSNLAPGTYYFYVNGQPLLTDTPVPAGTQDPVLLQLKAQ